MKDRSVRLVLFGLIATMIGGSAILLGALQGIVLVPAVGSLLPQNAELAADPARLALGSLTWILLGVAFVTLGVGSIRRRRWARALMLTLAWSWLLCGAASLLLVPALLDMALASTSVETAPAAASLLRGFMLTVVGLFGVLLPATFVWVYNDREMQRTCEALDRRPAWTDRLPAPVLGLAVALAACGVLFVPMAFQPAVPLFGRLVTGTPGASLMLVVAALSIGLALAVYRTSRVGWWGTTIFMVLLGVSTFVTQLRAPAAEWYAALRYPMAQGSTGAGPFGSPAALATTAVMTAASVIYMLRIRKYFPSPLGHRHVDWT